MGPWTDLFVELRLLFTRHRMYDDNWWEEARTRLGLLRCSLCMCLTHHRFNRRKLHDTLGWGDECRVCGVLALDPPSSWSVTYPAEATSTNSITTWTPHA